MYGLVSKTNVFFLHHIGVCWFATPVTQMSYVSNAKVWHKCHMCQMQKCDTNVICDTYDICDLYDNYYKSMTQLLYVTLMTHVTPVTFMTLVTLMTHVTPVTLMTPVAFMSIITPACDTGGDWQICMHTLRLVLTDLRTWSSPAFCFPLISVSCFIKSF